jgi:hypothetical protein
MQTKTMPERTALSIPDERKELPNKARGFFISVSETLERFLDSRSIALLDPKYRAGLSAKSKAEIDAYLSGLPPF